MPPPIIKAVNDLPLAPCMNGISGCDICSSNVTCLMAWRFGCSACAATLAIRKTAIAKSNERTNDEIIFRFLTRLYRQEDIDAATIWFSQLTNGHARFEQINVSSPGTGLNSCGNSEIQ